MTIFFDKNNLEAFLRNEGKESFAESMKMLRREVNVRANFLIEEAMRPGPSRDVIMKFVSLMYARPEKKTDFNFMSAAYPNRPVSVDFYAQPYAHRRSVILADDTELANCKKIETCIVGEVGEELAALSRLHRGERYKFSLPFTIGSGKGQFSAWAQLTPHILPFHDLIIHDRYLLRKPSWAVRHNLPLLLQALVRGRRGKLNIVLMTLPAEPVEINSDPVHYAELHELVSKAVVSETGEAPNFTVIWGEDGQDVRHDRHIFTNYQWLASHDSFNYFNSNGSIRTRADTLTLHNLADSELRTHADELLHRIQDRITALLAKNPATVEGDQVSSFLTFA